MLPLFLHFFFFWEVAPPNTGLSVCVSSLPRDNLFYKYMPRMFHPDSPDRRLVYAFEYVWKNFSGKLQKHTNKFLLALVFIFSYLIGCARQNPSGTTCTFPKLQSLKCFIIETCLAPLKFVCLDQWK